MSSHRGDDNDANTGGTVGATTSATSRRCHVRDENGDDKTHLDRGFGQDTTHGTTRSVRWGGDEGETGARRSSGCVCMRTRGYRKCASSIGSIFVCVSTAAGLLSLTRQAFLYDRKPRDFPVDTAIDEGGDRRARASLRKNHKQTTAPNARKTHN